MLKKLAFAFVAAAFLAVPVLAQTTPAPAPAPAAPSAEPATPAPPAKPAVKKKVKKPVKKPVKQRKPKAPAEGQPPASDQD
jgi:hypothetical protein